MTEGRKMSVFGEIKLDEGKNAKENSAGNTFGGFGDGIKSAPSPSGAKPMVPFAGASFGAPAPLYASAPSTNSTTLAKGFSFGSSPEANTTAASAFSFSALSAQNAAFGVSAGAAPTPKAKKEGSSSDAQPTSAKVGGVASRKKVSRCSLQHKSSDALEGYEHYREFMDKLADSGVDDYIDLPMIAVMGDTSSGKSSLLSSISLVELPSSDTLTTRCPIRLQMRNAPARSACVKVVWKDKPKCGDADFGERTVGEEHWSDITDIIAEAQAHIIEKSGNEVARDIVCVDVKGPHCENLTLIDLPGIVRSTGKGESSTLAEDIQALMHDYLDNERCVILAVHPSNVDFHNSQILAEAKKVDPGTKRTIPVLTKPDLIDDGAESSVKDLLLGSKTDKFEKGFHMVKGRGQKDLNEDVGIEDGLTKEEAFFRNKEPWRSVDDKSKFGTKNLRSKLARLQMQLIRESFKTIVGEMKERRDESAVELESLGDIPSNLREKRTLFRTVTEEIREGLGPTSLRGGIGQLHSSDDDNRPSADFHLASESFQQKLNSSKLANISSVQVGAKIIASIDNSEVKGTVCFLDDRNVYLKEKSIKEVTWDQFKKPKKLGTVFKSKGSVYHLRMDGAADKLQPIPLKFVRKDPQWISELIAKNRPYNLPIFLNPDLFDAIVASHLEEEWASPAMELLGGTANLMEGATEKFINQLKSIKSLPSLADFLARKSFEVVESTKRDAKLEISTFIEREKTPYTQNHYLFENLAKLRTQRLMDEVLRSVDIHNKGDKEDFSDNLTSAITDIFERNQRRSIDDHMAEEMQNALDSYCKVALKRFVDTVPMICIQILQRFPKMIHDILLDVTDSEIEQLVVAPPGAVKKMDALKKEVETLEKGIDTVNGLSKVGV